MDTQKIYVGITAALLACLAGGVFVIDAANGAGFSQVELVSWMFSIYLFGGITSLFLTIKYKIPLIGAHSIATAAFISVSASYYSLPELVGGYIFAGIIIVIVAFTGLFNKLIDNIPPVLVEAMLAGLLLKYIINAIPAMGEMPLVGVATFIGFLMTPMITQKIPRFIGALIIGTIVMIIVTPDLKIQIEYIQPEVIAPKFSMFNILSISIPVALLILSNEVAVALSALKKNGYDPPVKTTLMTSGVASSLAGFFGGHAAGVGGMTTTLCSSIEAGHKDYRYYSSIVAGILITLFGCFAWAVVSIIDVLPVEYITIIASFALLGILVNSLYSAFSKSDFYYSTVFTFLIALSDITIFQISSALWSIIIGIIVSLILKENITNNTKRTFN